MTIKKLTAEIWSPTENTRDDNGYGSGVLVAPGWILTACHVIAPNHNAPAVLEVEVRLLADVESGNRKWHQYDVVWFDEELDLALLKNKPGSEAKQCESIQCAKLTPDTIYEQCNFWGYPKAMDRSNGSQAWPFECEVNTSSVLNNGSMLFQVTRYGVKIEKKLSGLSGSAVTYNDCLIGIVLKASDQFIQNTVEVCPIERLLSHPQFSSLESKGLRLPPIVNLPAPHENNGQISYDDDLLPELVCYLDRTTPVSVFTKFMDDLVARQTSGDNQSNSFICVIEGEEKHAHGVLIERFIKETFPQVFSGQVSYSRGALLEFPITVTDVNRQFEDMKISFLNKLGILNDPDKLASRLNSGGVHRIFYTFIHPDEFSRDHKKLLAKWLKYWQQLGNEPLTCIVGFFCCIYTREKKHSKWQFWKRSEAKKFDFQFLNDSGSFSKIQLDFCKKEDLDDWLSQLNQAGRYSDAVRKLRPIVQKFYHQNYIAVGDVRSAVRDHCIVAKEL